MRQLTEQEQKIIEESKPRYVVVLGEAVDSAFIDGFVAGLDYQPIAYNQLKQAYDLAVERIELFHRERAQMVRELNAYAAFVAGKITLKELEEVING